ncbi:hypothetical protein ACP4OV_017748 [Aristida adscensionis]
MSGMEDRSAGLALAMPPVSPSSWLKSPRVTVTRIEVYVTFAAVLLFLQLILGYHRWRSGNIFIQGGLWVAYTLSFPLITNTIGQMVSAPVKNALYGVWVVSLYHILGSTNSAVAYDLNDNKMWTRRLFQQLQYLVYSYSILVTLYAKLPISTPGTLSDLLYSYSRIALVSLLLTFVMWSNFTSTLSSWMANLSNPTKVVADYMKFKYLSKGEPRRFANLEEYFDCYPVHCHDNFHPLISTEGSCYIRKLTETDDIITMGDIHKYCGGIAFSGPNGDRQLTDICLSFSLFQLLKRRYFGMRCAEAGAPEPLDLVLKGYICKANGDQTLCQGAICERTFRIVEVQLGFLYDFFFTRYAFYFELGGLWRNCAILKIILIILVGVFVYRNSISISTTASIIEVKTQRVDTIITLTVFGVLFVVEIVQLVLYMASDWANVAQARWHVKKKSNTEVIKSSYKYAGFLRRLTCFSGYWKNEIGQYSLLKSGPGYSQAMMFLYRQKMLHLRSFRDRMKSMLRSYYCWLPLCIYSFFFKKKDYVELSVTVKEAILSTLKSCKDQITNGEASLKAVDQSEDLFRRLKWALGCESQAEIMLIWHIATTYCEIAQQVNNIQTPQEGQGDLKVAKVLSRYCAYLMAFVPELLPDHEADTKFIFATAVNEAEKVWKLKSDREKYQCMEELLPPEDDTGLEEQEQQEEEQHNIIRGGIKLGRQLQSMDTALRWKVLANFWAEKLLYIAPSDNVKGHIEHLAKGGEFLTHIWALLSNAGILNIDRNHRPSRMDGQRAGENA